MTRGYLVMAQGPYLKQAEALAMSIKKTQCTVNNISIITDGDADATLFDQVIEIPSIDLAKNSNWKIHNRVFFYDLSPYDETVILDADMLFLSDVSHWWDMMSKYDLLITDKVKTFRGEWVTQTPYRDMFKNNQLANTYSAFTYFKKTDMPKEFFDLLKSIVINWHAWTIRYAPNSRQDKPSIDVAMGIAVKVMGIEEQVFSKVDYPTFTHMKGGCQGWKRKTDEWADILGVYTGNNEIKIGPYKQTGILHYVKKDFVDNKILELLK